MATRLHTSICTATIAILAGSAFSQTQVTAPNRVYHGWLSDQTSPKMWAWQVGNNGGVVFDRLNDGPYTTRWVHVKVDNPLYNTDGSVSTTEIENLANTIYTEWNLLGNPANYTLFIQNFGIHSGLFDNNSDKLSGSVLDQNSSLYLWPVGDPVLNHATPWMDNGVSISTAVLTALIDELNDGDSNDVPDPIRFFLDEEHGYAKLCNTDEPIAVYRSILNDTRSTSTILGNFEQFTALPYTANTIYGDVSWVPTLVSNGSQLCWPRVGINRLNRLLDVNRSSQDGIIASVVRTAISNTATWNNTLFSNYTTSTWFTQQYPSVGGGGFSAVAYTGTIGNEVQSNSTGWQLGVVQGSSDMQSPTLYPPNANHEDDFALLNTGETQKETWLRIARANLDHAIFSIDTMTTSDGSQLANPVPTHFAPWIPRVGTPTVLSGGGFVNITEEYARDLMAMVKSKGVNEALMWGDHSLETEAEWDANDNVTQQVWDYNMDALKSIYFDPNGTRVAVKHQDDGTMNYALFADEVTLDIPRWDRSDAVPFPGWDDNDGSAAEIFFNIQTSNNNLGSDYNLVIEALTGGGAWSGILNENSDSNYKLKIRNFTTSKYENINTLTNLSVSELYSTTTRRASYDPNSSNTLVVTYDDQGIVSNVIDRKDITKWSFSLDTPCDYIHPSGKYMSFQLRLWHDDESFTEDYQLDSILLYESTPAINDLVDQSSCSGSPLIADLDDNGIIDLQDIKIFLEIYTDPSLSSDAIDLNRDGTIDFLDLKTILRLSQNQQ